VAKHCHELVFVCRLASSSTAARSRSAFITASSRLATYAEMLDAIASSMKTPSAIVSRTRSGRLSICSRYSSTLVAVLLCRRLMGTRGGLTGLPQRLRDSAQELRQMVPKHVFVNTLRRTLFFRRADGPELDQRVRVTLQQLSNFDVGFCAYDVGVQGHDFAMGMLKKGAPV
jgi:hypothetical protein